MSDRLQSQRIVAAKAAQDSQMASRKNPKNKGKNKKKNIASDPTVLQRLPDASVKDPHEVLTKIGTDQAGQTGEVVAYKRESTPDIPKPAPGITEPPPPADQHLGPQTNQSGTKKPDNYIDSNKAPNVPSSAAHTMSDTGKGLKVLTVPGTDLGNPATPLDSLATTQQPWWIATEVATVNATPYSLDFSSEMYVAPEDLFINEFESDYTWELSDLGERAFFVLSKDRDIRQWADMVDIFAALLEWIFSIRSRRMKIINDVKTINMPYNHFGKWPAEMGLNVKNFIDALPDPSVLSGAVEGWSNNLAQGGLNNAEYVVALPEEERDIIAFYDKYVRDLYLARVIINEEREPYVPTTYEYYSKSSNILWEVLPPAFQNPDKTFTRHGRANLLFNLFMDASVIMTTNVVNSTANYIQSKLPINVDASTKTWSRLNSITRQNLNTVGRDKEMFAQLSSTKANNTMSELLAIHLFSNHVCIDVNPFSLNTISTLAILDCFCFPLFIKSVWASHSTRVRMRNYFTLFFLSDLLSFDILDYNWTIQEGQVARRDFLTEAFSRPEIWVNHERTHDVLLLYFGRNEAGDFGLGAGRAQQHQIRRGSLERFKVQDPVYENISDLSVNELFGVDKLPTKWYILAAVVKVLRKEFSPAAYTAGVQLSIFTQLLADILSSQLAFKAFLFQAEVMSAGMAWSPICSVASDNDYQENDIRPALYNQSLKTSVNIGSILSPEGDIIVLDQQYYQGLLDKTDYEVQRVKYLWKVGQVASMITLTFQSTVISGDVLAFLMTTSGYPWQLAELSAYLVWQVIFLQTAWTVDEHVEKALTVVKDKRLVEVIKPALFELTVNMRRIPIDNIYFDYYAEELRQILRLIKAYRDKRVSRFSYGATFKGYIETEDENYIFKIQTDPNSSPYEIRYNDYANLIRKNEVFYLQKEVVRRNSSLPDGYRVLMPIYIIRESYNSQEIIKKNFPDGIGSAPAINYNPILQMRKADGKFITTALTQRTFWLDQRANESALFRSMPSFGDYSPDQILGFVIRVQEFLLRFQRSIQTTRVLILYSEPFTRSPYDVTMIQSAV